MKKIFLLLITCLLFIPFIIKANERQEITSVEATSNLKDIVVIGKEVKNPTFNLTKGEPCYFGNEGKWQKYLNGNWSNYTETTFSSGTYRYYFVIKTDIDHTYNNMNGNTHYVNSIQTKITIDGKNTTITDNGPGVTPNASTVYAYTYSIEASEKTINEPVIEEPIVDEPVQIDYNQKPNKPIVAIQKGNNNSLIINIEKDNNVKSYDIYRSTNKKKGYKLIKNITNNSYTDVSLKYGTTYYYKVIAKNTYGKSTYSNIVSKKVVPNKVNDVTITNNTSTSLKLIYKLSGAKGYVIYRSTNPNSNFKQIASTTKTTYTDKKLKTGTTYYYKVKAYALVKKKKVYGVLSNTYSLEVKPSKPTININNSRSSLEFIFSNSEKVSYEISMLNGNEIVSTKTGSKVIFDNLTYGKSYKFKAFSYKMINNKKVKSEEVLLDEIVRPEAPKLSINEQIYYNQQNLHLTVSSLEENDKLEILIYKKDNENEEYKLVENETLINNSELYLAEQYGPFPGFECNFPFLNLNFNQKYYYKAVIKINGIESKAQYISKVSTVKPSFLLFSADSSNINFYFSKGSNDENEEIHYQIYRSTKKNGKYSLIMDKVLYPNNEYNQIDVNVGAAYNKTYYYKMRFYINKNGKKIFSQYSDVKVYKNVIKTNNKFPVSFTSNDYGYSKIDVKSINFSLKKRSGNYSIYTTKINIKSSYSTMAIRNKITLIFYDMNDKEIGSVDITINTPKGTKKNWSVTTNAFAIPSNAMYYIFK